MLAGREVLWQPEKQKMLGNSEGAIYSEEGGAPKPMHPPGGLFIEAAHGRKRLGEK